MSPHQRPEPGKNRKANRERAGVFALAFVAIMTFGSIEYYNQANSPYALYEKSITRTVSAFTPAPKPTFTPASKPTVTPAPTRTFARWKNDAETIPYDTLLRYAEQYEGEWVYFRGQVALIPNEGELWVYVARDQLTGSWNEEKMVLRYRDAPVRVLEDDMVSFVAVMDGISALHQIPELTVMALEIE